MDRSKALAALSALAHETRLDLIRLLTPCGAEGMAAGQIAETLGLAAPRLSFHLSALEQAGLLRSRKVARNVFYSVDARGIGQTVSYLLNDCCRDHPEVLAACSHRVSACQNGAGQSEVGQSEVGQSEVGLSEAGLSEAGQSEAGLSEVGQGEVGQGEVVLAGIVKT